MATRKFHLSDADVSELSQAFQDCRHADTKIRYQAVRLYGQGYPVAQIQDICGCHPRSLLRWCTDYQRGGIAALTDQRKGGNRARLKPEQIQRVEQWLHRYTPAQLLAPPRCGYPDNATGPGQGSYWNVADVARLLEQEYGIVFQTNASYYQLLAKCGMTYQRPAKQYKSHSPAKLMVFEETLGKKTA